ncbi:MAG: Ku protein, partial [Chthoniobacterales bacterium]
LLHKALSGTGKIGIAKVVISNREHLASVKPDGLFLVLELMHFASEILSPSELKTDVTGKIQDKELKMAQTLIESMSTPWEPEKYRDEYRNAVLEMIEQKANRKDIAAPPVAPPRATNVVDLVKVLQESLARNQSLKPKRNGTRGSGGRSASSLVKRKRRAAA